MGQDIGMVDGSHLWEGSTTKAIVDKSQGIKKVRALKLANNQEEKFKAENFVKMPNLHFVVLDGCDVRGDFGSISKELRWLQWRYMPSMHLPMKLELSNLTSMDFSYSTKLANLWGESNPSLKGCPNLLTLDLTSCTSITQLPDSIGHLTRLQVLKIVHCMNLQKLPSSIGQLTALRRLIMYGCENLEALPETITALSNLQTLSMGCCSSILKLPASMGLMSSLCTLLIDLTIKCQAVGLQQLEALNLLDRVH